MIDRLFAAALTFAVLIGGSLAIASAMHDHDQRAAAQARVVYLPLVEVQGKRVAPATAVAQTERTAPEHNTQQ